MHARKALLAGLSPKQNRDVPPLHYDWVYRLKKEVAGVAGRSINGGIGSVDADETSPRARGRRHAGAGPRTIRRGCWLSASKQLFDKQSHKNPGRRHRSHEALYVERQVRTGCGGKTYQPALARSCSRACRVRKPGGGT